MMIKNLSVAVALACIAGPAFGETFDNCKLPPTATSYREEFYSAQRTLMEYSAQSSGSFGITVPVDGVPIGASGAKGSATTTRNVTAQEATHAIEVIQKEINDRPQAILNECLYWLSCMPKSDNPTLDLAKTTTLNQICHATITGTTMSAGGPAAKEIQFFPESHVVAFERDTATVRARLRRLNAGPVDVAPPLVKSPRPGEVRYVAYDGIDDDSWRWLRGGPTTEIHLSERGDEEEVIFQLKRPPASAGVLHQSLEFPIVGDQLSAKAIVSFTLIPDPEALKKGPEISCGDFNPAIYNTAQEVNHSTGGYNGGLAQDNNWSQVGNSSLRTGYITQNGVVSLVVAEIWCKSSFSPAAKATVIRRLELEARTYAEMGNDKNNQVSNHWTPTWRSTARLTGDPAVYSYLVKIYGDLNSSMLDSCVFKIGPQTAQITPGNLNWAQFRVAPGDHDLRIECAQHINIPMTWNQHRTFASRFEIHAVRERLAGSAQK